MSINIIGRTLIPAGGTFLLSGDIMIKKRNFTFYLPLATSILISVILSAILIIINLIRR